LSKIDPVVDIHMSDIVMDLQTLIRQPSVSAKQEGLSDCAGLVAHIMRKAGIKTELLYLEDLEARAGKATCNITGLVAGYMEHSKTVLPSKALAKLDFRLVPDMVPEIQFNRLQEHLKEHGFAGKNEDSVTDGCATEMIRRWRTSI
jgi:acetylornithine deacetylase/succinyl-diaminopimelate desuccinylase-like protein